MANLRYSDKHNMVAFLKKPTESVGFTEIVDFIKGTSLRYALTHNPTIYDSLVKQFWQTATVRSLANGIQELVASIDNKEYTIIEASVRNKLQLADATGISNLSDAEIYEGLATLGSKSGGWDQFGSPIATALICLSRNKRGYAGELVPLLPAMLAGAAEDQGEGSANPAKPNPTSVDPVLSTSQIPIPSTTEPPHSSPLRYIDRHESLLRSHEAPLHEGHTSGNVEDSLQLKELMVLVPKLVTRIDNLEKELHYTKNTYGKAVLTLVERESIKEADFVTPTKDSASREAQEEEISLTILEAAQTSTGLDAEAEVNTGSEDFNPDSIEKRLILPKEQISTNSTGKSGFAEAIRLKALQDEEAARQVHFDALLAKRISEEQELSKQQKKRKPKIQEAAGAKNLSKERKKIIEKVPVIEESDTELVIVKEKEIEKPVKKRGKIKKQKARKGIHVDKTAQDETEEEREAFMKDKVTSASSESEIGIDAIPTAIKPHTILKDFSRDDLTELYKLVIKKLGANRPEEMYDRVLWGDLKTMFDPPLSDDVIWDRKYPLSKDACQVMLKMKLLDGTMDEAAIKSRFGGNEESKKMQKNVLKHQFENFTTASNESLDKAYDSQIALIMRNKRDIDQVDIDDLYNNLRVYEDEIKSTNEVTTASRNFGVNTVGGSSSSNQVSSTPGADEVIDQDDLEELDIRQQVAMLTVRVQRFVKKTGRNLDFKGKQPVTFDKSKVECYNCQRKGHFAKECKSGRNQGKRSNDDNGRRNATSNEPSSQALVAQDGLGGYD
ncbi:ribonuclease H-like domain-containing protein [Tanacetum coccineum]|uniref:Ribonuclease H-like domain-containing protein n=1 Tax=Tanacetum coccineum TaxID=301880 RepID=A0ABQ5FH90_9ASTR